MPTPLEIPYKNLSPDALKGIIEEFILREGTDYGHSSPELSQKKKQVLKQLESRRAKIVFDPESESCTIIPID